MPGRRRSLPGTQAFRRAVPRASAPGKSGGICQKHHRIGYCQTLTGCRSLCNSRYRSIPVRPGRAAPVPSEIRHAVPSLRGPPRRPAARARHGRRAHHADPPAPRRRRRRAAEHHGGRADEDDPQLRWQRALCDLAVHQLDDLGAQLGQLRDGPAGREPGTEPGSADRRPARPEPAPRTDAAAPVPLLGRVGSAEWNLLTDEVSWSEELCQIFGRDPRRTAPLTLDELPSWLFPEDQHDADRDW